MAASGPRLYDEDDRVGERVTIISHALWQRRYKTDRNIVGKTMVMNGERSTIIGVMPSPLYSRS